MYSVSRTKLTTDIRVTLPLRSLNGLSPPSGEAYWARSYGMLVYSTANSRYIGSGNGSGNPVS